MRKRYNVYRLILFISLFVFCVYVWNAQSWSYLFYLYINKILLFLDRTTMSRHTSKHTKKVSHRKKSDTKRKMGGTRKRRGVNDVEHYKTTSADILRNIHNKINANDLLLKTEYSELSRLLYNSQPYLDTIIPYSESIQDIFYNLVNNENVIQNEDVKWHILYIYSRVNTIHDEQKSWAKIDPSLFEPSDRAFDNTNQSAFDNANQEIKKTPVVEKEPPTMDKNTVEKPLRIEKTPVSEKEPVVKKTPVTETAHVLSQKERGNVPLYFTNSNEKLIEYWTNIFSNATKIDGYDLYAFKQDVLKKMKTSTLCEEIRSFYPNYNVSEKSAPYAKTYCILFFVLGTLSYMLYHSKTCVLLLKGGKAVQYTTDVVSDDIDILILPMKTKSLTNETITDETITEIGKKIADFVVWVTSDTSLGISSLSTPFSAIELAPNTIRDKSSHIIKVSLKLPQFDGRPRFVALMDIGLGYNHLHPYVKWLTQFHSVNLVHDYDKIPYIYCVQDISTLMREKMFFIVLYSSTSSQGNQYFRERAYRSLYKVLTSLHSENDQALLADYLTEIYRQLYPHLDMKTKKNKKMIEQSILQIIHSFFMDNEIPRWRCHGEYCPNPNSLYTNDEIMQMPNSALVKLPNWTTYITVEQLFRL